MESNLFRVGGVYRNKDGDLVRLEARRDTASHNLLRPASVRVEKGGSNIVAFHDLATGESDFGCGSPSHFANLLPGELTHIKGKGWVPVSEQPVKSIGALVREQEAASAAASAANAAASASAACSKEKLRPALTWNKPAITDRWAGYVVTSSTEEHAQQSGPLTASPDLQATSAQVAPCFGTALVKL